jgi:hypothetical protein
MVPAGILANVEQLDRHLSGAQLMVALMLGGRMRLALPVRRCRPGTRRRSGMVDHHLGLMEGTGCNGGTCDEADAQKPGAQGVQVYAVVVVMVPVLLRRMMGPWSPTAACPGRQRQGEDQENHQTGR